MIGKSMSPTDERVADASVGVRTAGNRPARARGAGFALFIAGIALCFTVVGIAAGYKHWQRMHDRAKDNARRIEVLEAGLANKMDSRSLAALMTVPVHNVTEVSVKINQLLAQLPLHSERPMVLSVQAAAPETALGQTAANNTAKSDDETNLVTAENPSLWSASQQRVLAVLSHFVTVQKIEPSVASALQQEQQAAAHNLIRLRLESLRLMALQGDSYAYQQQLELLYYTLNEVMVDHYPAEQIAVWRTALNELAAVDLQPERHDFAVDLRQLRQSSPENRADSDQ